MIQYPKELKEQIQKLDSDELQFPCFIQKIYTTSQLICLTFRFVGKTQFAYLGRGNRVEGFWLSDLRPPSILRRLDRFLDYLRHHLTSTELISVDQIFEDRCIKLTYQKYGKQCEIFFFWKGRALYFQNYYFEVEKNVWKIFQSWSGAEFESTFSEDEGREYCINELIKVGLIREFENEAKESNTNVESILSNEERGLKKINGGKKLRSKAKKRLDNIKQDLEKINEGLEVYELINDIDFSKIQGKFTHKRFKVSLGYGLNDFEKRDKVYNKLKNLKKAVNFQKSRLEEAEKIVLSSKEPTKYDLKLKMIEPVWKSGHSLKKQSTHASSNYSEYILPSHIKFAVGKNTKGNDEIRSQWASKSDLWFHLDGDTSAHLICKIDGFSRLTADDIAIIASCLRDVSRDDKLEVNFFYTQVKNLRGLKGKQGSVLYKKEKYYRVMYLENWKDLCLQS